MGDRTSGNDGGRAFERPAELVSLLDRHGALDFRDLTNDDIAAWLAALGAGPTEMPVTSDPATAGATARQGTVRGTV